jgi:basic membrane protein A
MHRVAHRALGALLIASVVAGCGARLQSPERGPFVAVLVEQPQDAERLKRVTTGIERARRESRATFRVIDGVPVEREAMLKALRSAAASDAKMVVGFGTAIGPAMQRVAWEFPEQRFTLIEGAPEVLRPNLAIYDLLSPQSYFLAGAFAGLSTKSNVVGLIGVKRDARDAFAAGLRETNARARLLEANVVTLGDALAALDQQVAARTDIAMVAEAPWTPALADAARGREIRLIGADRDWTTTRADVFVGAAIDEPGDAVLAAFRDVRDAVWRGDIVRRFGVRSGAVGLVLAKDVSPAIRRTMEAYRDQIGAGRLEIPGVLPPQRPLSGK